jgi:hypothetical protein
MIVRHFRAKADECYCEIHLLEFADILQLPMQYAPIDLPLLLAPLHTGERKNRGSIRDCYDVAPKMRYVEGFSRSMGFHIVEQMKISLTFEA